ncbi:hypothetical protein CORC01_06102 [Colletotrichum orchidophilum]|uniref:Uncharacterized protein n=1 Tax=Colletotrichum orchidophilum TaxID=1209926 RepID=A0A1G4BB67_9PEZI|nr:uncharacterized protein CORC01_06102 [Colletotrichum orchidophilum]OHE98651.1 hypothetical protein CORC01_06102 [Colletotrichum orchidophilum]
MASQRILATPPSQGAMLDRLVDAVRRYNARQPRLYVGLGDCNLDVEMPLLLNPTGAPVACMEPPDEFEAVNAHFSAQVHAFFNALHALEHMAVEQSPDEPHEPGLIREDGGLQLAIRIVNQSYDIYPDCWHRIFHTRRLAVQNPDSLPLLNRVTQLRVLPATNYSNAPDMHFVHLRPVSPRVPLELAARLPHLRELDCPWLWERLPLAFSSQALRICSRPWEGPWRDARIEFGRGVRQLMPLLPSSLTKARLWFWRLNSCGDDTDQAVHMPDLVDAPSSSSSSSSSSPSEFEGMDPVSLGLGDLGSRLEELSIRALITPDLFRSLSWPHMRHLKVEFHPCAPDGRWYFSGPRGEDPHAMGFAITREEHYPPGLEDADETHALLSREEDEFTGDDEMCLERRPDMFRILPIAERINPLLMAFALSLQRQNMPFIQDAEMFTWLLWRPSEERAQEYQGNDDAPPSDEDQTVMFRWGVRYDAPDGDGKGKVTWQVGEDWRPGDELLKAFGKLVGGDGENMEWEVFDFVEEREPEAEIF